MVFLVLDSSGLLSWSVLILCQSPFLHWWRWLCDLCPFLFMWCITLIALCISNTEFFICRISSFSQFPCWIFLPFDEFSSMCLTVSSILLNFLYVTVFPFQVLDWLHLIVCVLSQVIDHFTRKLLQSSSGILTISVFLSSVVVSCELLEESCCFPSSYSLHLLAEMACLFIF